MTLSEMITATRALVLDGNGERFTDAELTVFLNRGMQEFAAQTRCYADTISFAYTPDTENTFYTDNSVLRNGVISVEDSDGNIYAEIKENEIPDIERHDLGYNTCRWYKSGQGLYIWPELDAADTLSVRAYVLPENLSDEDDEPAVEAEYHMAPVWYTAYMCQSAEGNINSAMIAKREFDGLCGKYGAGRTARIKFGSPRVR